jgi:hypothetical protein
MTTDPINPAEWNPRYLLYCRDIGKRPGWEKEEGANAVGFILWSNRMWREYFAAHGIPGGHAGLRDERPFLAHDHAKFNAWFEGLLADRVNRAAWRVAKWHFGSAQ